MQGIQSLPYQIQEQPIVPTGGLQDIRNAADMLADFGREGDTYIVHAAEGETVVPVEVLEANPRMKNMIFRQMEEMGLDPERYIVGNELNSLNPVTGQPEFFFKKIFKKIKKIVKKVAPIILPIAAPFLLPAMPIAFASGIGSLAGNLIAGKDLKTSLKNAVITGGLSGLGNVAFGGSEGFGSGAFFGSRAAPMQGLGTFSAQQAMTPVNPFSQSGTDALKALQTQAGVDTGGISTLGDQTKDYIYDPAENISTVKVDPTSGKVTVNTTGEGTLESFLSPNRSSINPTNIKLQAGADAANQSIELAKAFNQPIPTQDQLYKTAMDVASSTKAPPPGFFAKYGPMTAVGGAAGLTYLASQQPPVDENGDGIDDVTGLEILEQDKSSGAYMYGFDAKKFYGDNPFYQGAPFITVASGGEIVGPGTPTSDSIPALLSDGEFVMNAKAVRGAGGGDRKTGAARMYQMMKQFERSA